MATWRRRDLERRHSERSRRFGRVSRPEFLLSIAAALVAAVALWQAFAAQSRADLLAHDLSVANARLRDEGAAPVSRPLSADAEAAAPPVPLPPAPSLSAPAANAD